MNGLEALRKFKAVIRQDSRIAEHCGHELSWIQRREQDWSSDRIRVGVVGVTSSGKSTLINAILGKDILSSAIAPSSGQLVCCSYGDAPEIVVRFENGAVKKLKGEQFSCEELMQFSDERFNPKNEKGVLSIELTSPQFDLGKDVLLVDSPGLDAFGLETHEKLTLESLVPTIDACIYVTTMKTNSDRKTREILNTVAKYNCPIIIAQNMLDAVRPSPSGDKTSEQVAWDHRKRVQRIVDGSDITDKGSVRIIQISAEYAKQWRSRPAPEGKAGASKADYERSNYEAFVRSVSEILEVQRPRIERQRLLSVIGQMRGAADHVKEKLEGPTQQVEASFPLQSLKERAGSCRVKFEKDCRDAMAEFQRVSREIGAAIEDDAAGEWELETQLEKANEAVRRVESQLAALMSECNQFVIAAAAELNIPSRDLLCSRSLCSFRELRVEKKTVTEKVRVEKSGVFGRAARFFGSVFNRENWGYEYEPSKKVVTDIEETKKKIRGRLQEAYDRYRQTMEDWSEKNFKRSMELIGQEIAAEEENYDKRREAAVTVEALAKLHQALTQLIGTVEKDVPDPRFAIRDGEQAPAFRSRKVEAGAYVGSVLMLSREALRAQHREIARKFVQAIGCAGHVPVVIGWDEGSKDEFLNQTGIRDPEIILSPPGRAQFQTRKRKCVFVLTNTVQFGAAVKQIAALKLEESLNGGDFVVWVVQDLQELMAGGRGAEGLSQMGELHFQAPVPCPSMIYLLHRNPLYNLAFLKYQMDPSLRKTPERLIHEVQTAYQPYTSEKTEQDLSMMLRSVCLRDLDKGAS